MNVHILQHVTFEGPGAIADWCIANGHQINIHLLSAPRMVLPDVEDVDLLVIMGGPMNVYDEDTHPWLAAEKVFIREFLTTDRPVLGICLGAQLLAVCSGASVGSATQLEIGWFAVKPTVAAENFPWLYSLLAVEPILFHWHGDRFAIPAGGENLAITEANDNQAFVLSGGRVVGLQFHPEVTPPLLEQMMAEGRHELRPGSFVQGSDTILTHAEYRKAGMLMRGVMEHLEGMIAYERSIK